MALLSVTALPMGVAIADHPVEAPVIVSATSGAPGDTVEVAGSCVAGPTSPGEDAVIDLDRRLEPSWRTYTLKWLDVSPVDGSFGGTLVVPADASAGGYLLTVYCLNRTGNAIWLHEFDFEVLEGAPNPNWSQIDPTEGYPGAMHRAEGDTIRVWGVCMFTSDRPADSARAYLPDEQQDPPGDDGRSRPDPEGPMWARSEPVSVSEDGSFETTVTLPGYEPGSPRHPGGDQNVVVVCEADGQRWESSQNVFSVYETTAGGGRVHAEISTNAGAPGDVVEVSGICEAARGVPGNQAGLYLSRSDGWGTSTTVPVADDASFAGHLIIPVEATPGPYTLDANCSSWEGEEGGIGHAHIYYWHKFAFEVLKGAPNPNWAEIEPNQGPPGTTIRLVGVCMFTPDSPADTVTGTLRRYEEDSSWIWFDTTPGPDGSFEATVTVPHTDTPQEAVVTAICSAADQEMRQMVWPFTITSATDGSSGHPAPQPPDGNSPGTNPTTRPLPATGGGTGMAILAVMIALIMDRRQRRQDAP